jgi:hypothetical protein
MAETSGKRPGSKTGSRNGQRGFYVKDANRAELAEPTQDALLDRGSCIV